MAKMFYNAEEAARELGVSQDQLKDWVREGKLREFRDAGSVNYKVDDVGKLASQAKPASPAPVEDEADESGEILLEPVEDSNVELAPSGSDVISLEDTSMRGDTATGATAVGRLKESTVVPSIGVNVFDDDDVGEEVDPLAQTAVTDLAGLGIDGGAGSGSGILDLTRESDDTSLGRELLDEIYTDDNEGASAVQMGDSTRAGLEGATPEAEEVAEAEPLEPAAAVSEPHAASVAAVAEASYAPDAASSGLTALMVVAVAVMWVAGLAGASLVRGITPGLIQAIYDKLWVFAAGTAVIGAAAAAGTYVLAKRSN